MPQAVVLADGRCAVCRAADGGLASSEPIQLSHFVCRAGSGAVCARIGALQDPPWLRTSAPGVRTYPRGAV